MAVIRASDDANLLDVALSKVFYRFLADVPTEHSRWINVERMDRAWEDYMKAAAFGTVPQKDEGALIQFENIATSDTKRIETVEFALGYVVTRKMRDDEKHGVVIGLTQGLRESVRNLYETRAYRVLNNATATGSNFLGLDGKALIATDHPLLKDGGSTQANKPAADVDMTSATVESAIINFSGIKKDNGFPAMVTPETAIFNYQQQYEGARIFRNAPLQAGTADNDQNWVRMGPDNNGVKQYISSKFLTDTNAWFLVAPKRQHDAVLRVRVSPEFKVGSDFRTDNMLARVYTRIESTFYNYFYFYGSTGSS
jgi:hypothetical protein